jgi:hypothetical protein
MIKQFQYKNVCLEKVRLRIVLITGLMSMPLLIHMQPWRILGTGLFDLSLINVTTPKMDGFIPESEVFMTKSK